MVVNTASRCGFAPQYKGWKKFIKNTKIGVLLSWSFPSNDFNQEFSSNEKIKEFCEGFRISFPLFASASVKGPAKLNQFRFPNKFVPSQSMQGDVRWNFENF